MQKDRSGPAARAVGWHAHPATLMGSPHSSNGSSASAKSHLSTRPNPTSSTHPLHRTASPYPPRTKSYPCFHLAVGAPRCHPRLKPLVRFGAAGSVILGLLLCCGCDTQRDGCHNVLPRQDTRDQIRSDQAAITFFCSTQAA